jgi:hypothetical protein
MRRLLLTLLLAGTLLPTGLLAQHAFDDLPVDDPSKRSVLVKGEDPAKKIRNNIFIFATLDHPECYQGQQVLLSYKLYTALQSTSTVTVKPILNGFAIKERRPDETPLPDKTIDGRRYHGFTVWQALLTPLQPGEYPVDPLQTTNDVSYPTPDGKTAHYSGPVSSHRTTIHVLRLPGTDRPPSFTGLVGKWSIQSRLTSPRTDSSGNDTLIVEIAGSGSFQNITAPYMRWPAGFRHREPIQRWVISDSTTPQSGKTTIAIPFTAATPGQYSLPPMDLAWFDPTTEKFHTKSTDSLIVHVLTAPAPQSPAAAPPVQTHAPATQPSGLLKFGIPGILVITLIGVILLFRRRKSRTTSNAAEGVHAAPPVISHLITHAPQPITNVPITNAPITNAPFTNAPITNAPITNAPFTNVPITNAPQATANAPSTTPEPPTPLPPQPNLPKEDLALAEIKQTLIQFLQARLHTDAWAEEDVLNILQQKDPSLAGKAQSLLDECNQLLYSPVTPEPRIIAGLNRRLEAILQMHQGE